MMAAPLPDYFLNTTVYSLSLIDCTLISLKAFALQKAKLTYIEAFPLQRQNCNGAETGMCLLFDQLFVRIYVQSAMKALAEVEKGHAVHVKVVAAGGAPGQGCNSCDDGEEDNPDDKGHSRFIVRLGQLEGCTHGRHVDEDHPP